MLNGFESHISLGQLMAIIHQPTEVLKVHVVSDSEMFEDHIKEFYLTKNAFNAKAGYGGSETERLIKYYANIPVWNIVASIESIPFDHEHKGDVVHSVIEAHCHYRDLRDAYAREAADIRKAKQKAYRERRKAKQAEEQNNKD